MCRISPSCHCERKRGNLRGRKREHFRRLTNTAFVLAISTAQRICAIGSGKEKTPAAVPPNYLLGGVLRAVADKKIRKAKIG